MWLQHRKLSLLPQHKEYLVQEFLLVHSVSQFLRSERSKEQEEKEKRKIEREQKKQEREIAMKKRAEEQERKAAEKAKKREMRSRKRMASTSAPVPKKKTRMVSKSSENQPSTSRASSEHILKMF